MRKTLQYQNFRGLMNAANGAKDFAFDLQNVRIEDGKLQMRRGYVNLLTKPTGFAATKGITWAEGFSENTYVAELISIEDLGGSAFRPYKINTTTGARTQLTNNGASVSIGGTPQFYKFGSDLITITPEQTTTAWKYTPGVTTSWTPLDNSDYTPVNPSPLITVTTGTLRTFQFESGDTWTYTKLNGAGINSPVFNTPVNGAVTLGGVDDDDGIPARSRLQVVFATPKNFTNEDHFAVVMEAGEIFDKINQYTANVQVRIAGVWTSIESSSYTSGNKAEAGFVARLKGVSGIASVEGIRWEIETTVQRYKQTPNTPAIVITPIRIGGTFLNATNTTVRPWNTASGTSIQYAVRYKTGATYSDIDNTSITAEQARGFTLSFAPVGQSAYGAYVYISAPETGSWTDVQFLRLPQGSSTWKVIGTVSAASSPGFRDTFQENELAALPDAVDVVGETPEQPPAFTANNIVCGGAYKSWFVWGYKQGFSNIGMSRVGDAYETYDADTAYEPTDETQPAVFTLADNGADVPVNIIASADILYVVGERGCYATVGQSPRSCIPFRKINNAPGSVGYFAATSWGPDDATRTCVWMARDGSVWAATGVPRFEGDIVGDPIELTDGLAGGTLKDYLTQDGDDLSDVRVIGDTEHQKLWFVLGRRVVCYDDKNWLLNKYTVKDVPTELCTPFGYGSATVDTHNRTGWTDDWANPSNALNSNNNYATAVMGSGDKTKWLRVNNIKSSTIPSDATLNSLTFQFEHSTSGGNVIVINDGAHLMHNGAQLGDNKATLAPVPNSDTLVTATFTPPFPDGVNTALYNSGTLGFELGYQAATYVTNSSDITITLPSFQRTDGATVIPPTTHTHTITVNWIGAGPAPQYALLNITGTADAGGYASGGSPTNFAGSGSVTGINGTVVSATIEAPTVTFDEFINVTESKTPVLVTFVGNTGTAQVTMSGNVTLTTFGLNNFGYVRTEVTAATLIAPSATTIRVDNVAVQACYTPAPTDRKWISATYKPLEGNILLQRETGEIDQIERDENGDEIVGVNRDANLHPVTDSFYTFAPIDFMPGRGRLVYMSRQSDDGLVYPTASCLADGVTYNATGVNNSSAVRFPMHKALRILPKITFGETTTTVNRITTEYTLLSRTRF